MVTGARSRLTAPLLAAGLALLAILTGAQGVDLAAATYRVELFARSGLTLWDSQWYGGHWTFDYSVLFAPIGWLAGSADEIVCVAVAAWAFDRLAVGGLGRLDGPERSPSPSAPWSRSQSARSRICSARRSASSRCRRARRALAVALPIAVAASLASPLAGGFLAMAALAWLIGSWPERRWAAGALAAAAATRCSRSRCCSRDLGRCRSRR